MTLAPFGVAEEPPQPRPAADDFTLRAIRPDRVPVKIEGRARPLMAWRLVREWEQTPSEAIFDLGPHMDTIRTSLRNFDETPQYKSSRRHFEAYVTRCLMVLIPGLEEEQAELMGEQRIAWLIALGWFKGPEQSNGVTDGSPPEKADESTAGEEPEPDSPATTE
jgi:hypothetical protein